MVPSVPGAALANHPETTPEPVRAVATRALVERLRDWLGDNRADGPAHELLSALTAETLKRIDSPEPGQREFDAQDLASAAAYPESDSFQASKRWVERAKLEVFFESRRKSIEEYFRAAGQACCLQPARRSPGGLHRAVWFLEAYDLPTDEPGADATDEASQHDLGGQPSQILRYDLTPPGQVKAAWYARPLIGSGSFETRSGRGALWLTVLMLLLFTMLLGMWVVWGLFFLRRPILTTDLATLVFGLGGVFFIWRFLVQPMFWLVEDRIIPANEMWVAWREENAQLELAKGPDGKRRLQLVRYAAVCPVCAGVVELRYSQRANRRRLIGCCREAPHDHVFSFDRILRIGERL